MICGVSATEALVTAFAPLYFFCSIGPVEYFPESWKVFTLMVTSLPAFAPIYFFSSMGPVKYFWQSWQYQKPFFVMSQQQKLLLQFLPPLSFFFGMVPVKYFPQSWHCQKTFFVMLSATEAFVTAFAPL